MPVSVYGDEAILHNMAEYWRIYLVTGDAYDHWVEQVIRLTFYHRSSTCIK